jgi:hypothetical protein
VLRRPELAAELDRRAKRIAAAANSSGGDYRTDLGTTRMRARAAVMGDYNWPRKLAASRAVLLRALDAGR